MSLVSPVHGRIIKRVTFPDLESVRQAAKRNPQSCEGPEVFLLETNERAETGYQGVVVGHKPDERIITVGIFDMAINSPALVDFKIDPDLKQRTPGTAELKEFSLGGAFADVFLFGKDE